MTARIPKYRRQKRKNSPDLAFVELDGQRHYLGEYGTPQSKQKYHRMLAEWDSAGEQLLISCDDITVVELIRHFWKHAATHYRKPDGTPTSELDNFRQALRPVRELYGLLPVKEFGPLKLKTVRKVMIEKGWCRTSINRVIGRIRIVFRWGIESRRSKVKENAGDKKRGAEIIDRC